MKLPILPFAVLVIVFWPINQALSAVRAVTETVRSWKR